MMTKRISLILISIFLAALLLTGCKTNQNAANKTNHIYKLDIICTAENDGQVYRVYYPDQYYGFNKEDMKCYSYTMNHVIAPENITLEDFTYITEYIENLPANENFNSDTLAFEIALNYYDANGVSQNVFVKGYDELPEGWSDFIDRVNGICGEEYLSGEGELVTVTPEFLTEVFGVTDEDVLLGTLSELIEVNELQMDDITQYGFNMQTELEAFYAIKKEPLIEPYRPVALDMVDSTQEEYDLFVEDLLATLGDDWKEVESDEKNLRCFQSLNAQCIFYLGRSADLDQMSIDDKQEYYLMEFDAHMEDMIYSAVYYYNHDKKYVLVGKGLSDSVEEVELILTFIYLGAENETSDMGAVMEDYETSLLDATASVSEQLEKGVAVDEIVLPPYLRILDSYEGDIGNNLYKDKVFVLEFTEEVPDEAIVGHESDQGRRIICVFSDTGLGKWQCIARNNILLHETEEDIYRDVVIENGKLTVSIAGDTPCNWNNTYQFGLNRTGKGMQLERIEDWQSDKETGEGFYAMFDYDTGVITWNHITDHKKENMTDLYRVAMFHVDSFGGPSMEEVEASEEHGAKPDVFFLEEKAVLKAVQDHVSLEEACELESFEWVGEENRCFRVGIRYEEEPENAYIHKEDYYFFFDADNTLTQVLHEDYEDIHIGAACDFNAHFEDVTFDGKEDLIVFIGDGRYERYYTAYVYENGQYMYKKSFEQIPTYQTDAEAKIITGERGPADNTTYYTFGYENGEFVVLTEETVVFEG